MLHAGEVDLVGGALVFLQQAGNFYFSLISAINSALLEDFDFPSVHLRFHCVLAVTCRSEFGVGDTPVARGLSVFRSDGDEEMQCNREGRRRNLDGRKKGRNIACLKYI